MKVIISVLGGRGQEYLAQMSKEALEGWPYPDVIVSKDVAVELLRTESLHIKIAYRDREEIEVRVGEFVPRADGNVKLVTFPRFPESRPPEYCGAWALPY